MQINRGKMQNKMTEGGWDPGIHPEDETSNANAKFSSKPTLEEFLEEFGMPASRLAGAIAGAVYGPLMINCIQGLERDGGERIIFGILGWYLGGLACASARFIIDKYHQRDAR